MRGHYSEVVGVNEGRTTSSNKAIRKRGDDRGLLRKPEAVDPARPRFDSGHEPTTERGWRRLVTKGGSEKLP